MWKVIKQRTDKKNLFFPKMDAGDALILKTFTFHGSTPYSGNDLRWTLIGTFHPFNKVPYLINKKLKSFAIPYDADYNWTIISVKQINTFICFKNIHIFFNYEDGFTNSFFNFIIFNYCI